MKIGELLDRDVNRLKRAIASKLEIQVDHPSLVVLVGLPGSGKSYFASKMTENISAVVLESDFLRKNLVLRPVYTQFESFRLFRAIHELITDLLANKYNVVLDATSLTYDSRRPLYDIAKEEGAKVIVVYLNTPREVAEERLSHRMFRPDGYSEADWAVYQKLEPGFEPLTEPHYEITEAMDISPVVAKIVAEITQNQ
jgi:hypothetical protein